MEFNARYTLIGVFTLVVITACFVFVYWLNTIGGLQQRDFYRIRFETPVIGLTRGSRVLYNGLHIGEVDKLDLDFEQPGRLFATISIRGGFPIRSDTHVGVDYQNLTGGAAISLTGVGKNADILKPGGPEMPMLVAGTFASVSWIQAARRALNKFNDILSDNAPALSNSISNIETFTNVLSENSSRFSNIIAGLERFAGGVKDKSKDVIFDLAAPLSFPSTFVKKDWTLLIAEPSVQLAFNTDKIMIESAAGQTKLLADGRWSDNLPNLVQSKLMQAYENAGLGDSVTKPSFGDGQGYQLKVDVRRFHLSTVSDPEADIIFFVKLSDSDGKSIASQLFKAKAPSSGVTPEAATAALQTAFQALVIDVMSWVHSTL